MKTVFVSFFVCLFVSLLVSAFAGVKEDGMAFLEANRNKPGVITLPSGLQYKILKAGGGAFHPKIDTPCEVHYHGTLITGQVFDSSVDRGSPSNFAPNQVIKGWTEALQMMVEGDKWEVYLPSELAYGERGSGAKIKGGATLIFTIELLTILGDKVPASKCDVVTLKGCSNRDVDYLEKKRNLDNSQMQDELMRLEKLGSDSKMKETLISWVQQRIILLKKLMEVKSSAQVKSDL